MAFDLRRATLLALIAGCLTAAPALAQNTAPLAGQFAQVQATPTPGGEPPLSDEPEEPLGNGDDQGGGGDADTGGAAAPKADDLPKTGADAGLIALFGLGLLTTGCGLRLSLDPPIPAARRHRMPSP